MVTGKVITLSLTDKLVQQPSLGWLLQTMPWCEEKLGRIEDFHLVMMLPGTTRANHYHELAIEILIPLTSGLLFAWEDADGRSESLIEKPDRAFLIEAGVPHAVRNDSSGEGIVMGISNRRYRVEAPDRIPYKLL